MDRTGKMAVEWADASNGGAAVDTTEWTPDSEWPRPPLWRRIEWLPEAIIGFIGAATIVVGVITYAVQLTSPDRQHGYIALAVSAAGWLLAWKLRWPSLILAVCAPLVAALFGVDPIIEWNVAGFTGCLLVMRGLRAIPCGVIIAVANFAAVIVYNHAGFSSGIAIAAVIGPVAFIAIGVSINSQSRYWDQVSLRTRELAEARDTEVSSAVTQERMRIARDIHDMIGHEVAVVNMHLGAAEVHLETAPDLVGNDISQARESVQQVLYETQRILSLLRTSTEEEGIGKGVQTNYAQIPALVEDLKSSGMEIEVTLPEDEPPLTPEASRAVYRIVQEGLTNASKHGTGTVSLRLYIQEDSLWIVMVNVVNDKQEHSTNRVGYGLVGMRERAASVGGSIEASRDGNLYWLRASIPVDSVDSGSDEQHDSTDESEDAGSVQGGSEVPATSIADNSTFMKETP